MYFCPFKRDKSNDSKKTIGFFVGCGPDDGVIAYMAVSLDKPSRKSGFCTIRNNRYDLILCFCYFGADRNFPV